jgi:hypothetical protein
MPISDHALMPHVRRFFGQHQADFFVQLAAKGFVW